MSQDTNPPDRSAEAMANMAANAAGEGTLREQLAAYFLSSPPYGSLPSERRAEYLSRLRTLGELELQEVLQSAGSSRPLSWGNPVPLLQNLLSAAQRLAAGCGQPLLLFPAADTGIEFSALLQPRLLALGLVSLLRMACAAAPKQPVWIRLREQASCLTVSATAARPFYDPKLAAVVKETARLHGGSLAVCKTTVGFSCGRAAAPPADVHPYPCPSAQALYRDTLSPVWTGFYAWLPVLLAAEGGSSGSGEDAGSSAADGDTGSGSGSADTASPAEAPTD